MALKILSWNVNGLRATMKKGFHEFVRIHKPDIVCLQETKASKEQILESMKKFPELEQYRIYSNSANKLGYSGTAIMSLTEPISTESGIQMEHHDTEGRVITAEYEHFSLVNVYTPNSKPDLSRLDYRQGWDSDFLKYLQDLERRKNKPVIACGDFNVAHRDIDLARPQQNRGKHGFTDQEREGFDKLLAGGFVDSFRHLHGDMSSCYTYWSMQSGARKSNVGWRIDYFLASTKLAQQSNITRAFILDDVEGSDHCPIGIEVKF